VPRQTTLRRIWFGPVEQIVGPMGLGLDGGYVMISECTIYPCHEHMDSMRGHHHAGLRMLVSIIYTLLLFLLLGNDWESCGC
jgi:hypothetical protein